MRIMFYMTSLNKGGAERVISNLSNYFSENNHEVYIVLNTKKTISYKLEEKVSILELDNKKIDSLFIRNMHRINSTKKIVNQIKPDIVISFLPAPSFRILLLKNRINCKIIVSDRNDPSREYKKLVNKVLMKILYKRADGFVFQTKDQQNYFSKEIRDKSIIILNPIKDEFLKHNEKIRENIIVNIGRLHKQKNQLLLIESFAQIMDEFKDYKLKIYGEGNLRKNLQNRIDELNANNRIELCGVSSDIKSVLDNSKVFVLSSDYEGMPNALMEAMASGLACISTNCPCGGPKELISDRSNGILVPVNDKEKLTSELRMLLGDEAKIKSYGKEARKIVDNLSQSKIEKEWENYLMKVANDEK